MPKEIKEQPEFSCLSERNYCDFDKDDSKREMLSCYIYCKVDEHVEKVFSKWKSLALAIIVVLGGIAGYIGYDLKYTLSTVHNMSDNFKKEIDDTLLKNKQKIESVTKEGEADISSMVGREEEEFKKIVSDKIDMMMPGVEVYAKKAADDLIKNHITVLVEGKVNDFVVRLNNELQKDKEVGKQADVGKTIKRVADNIEDSRYAVISATSTLKSDIVEELNRVMSATHQTEAQLKQKLGGVSIKQNYDKLWILLVGGVINGYSKAKEVQSLAIESGFSKQTYIVKDMLTIVVEYGANGKKLVDIVKDNICSNSYYGVEVKCRIGGVLKNLDNKAVNKVLYYFEQDIRFANAVAESLSKQLKTDFSVEFGETSDSINEYRTVKILLANNIS